MSALASFRYRPGGEPSEVAVGPGALRLLGQRLPAIAPGRWFVVSSEPVFGRHGDALLHAARGASLDPAPLLVPDGERAKTWAVLGRLLSELVARGLRRDGGIVAFGGGTVGDVAGLAAALALRGVPIVQVPTTLLAAADSALGGKTGVDLPEGKNLAGAVHQPRLVLVEPALLATLSDRAYRSGLAEVVKCSMLEAGFDRAMGALEPRLLARGASALSEAVRRSLRLKAHVVAEDPEERRGRRVILNLGHTVGHALESASRYRLLHGEAVGWGLRAILEVSRAEAGLSARDADRLDARVRRLVAPPEPGPGALATWPSLLGRDKKADREGLKAVLLRAPGRPTLRPVTAEALEAGFRRARTAELGRRI